MRIVLALGCWLLFCCTASAERPPNIVLIYCDDLGYGDLSCYGQKAYKTPQIDALAAAGMRFTDFHTVAAVCSASRAALMTGCYPQRVGILGALGPNAKHGIADEEVLLPEMLKRHGYATAIYGKWHLGHLPQFLPTKHGFDDYFGLPYSNDMWPFHPAAGANFPPLPLYDRERVAHHNPDQTKLTGWYTDRAVKFIEANRDDPFFLYVPHSMPHVPLYVGYEHYGKTGAGLYADVIAEIDSSVGRIMEALRKQGLADNTLVMFSSDNGPWLSYGNHAGSSGNLREGKATTFEGGMRVPLIAHWPKGIAAGKECDELCSTMDILPTIAAIVGDDMPRTRKIDGHDIGPLLKQLPGAKSPYQEFRYYWDHRLDAIRTGPWKLHFAHEYPSLRGVPGKDGKPHGYQTAKIEQSLFNLHDDPGESRDVAADHPEIVAKLEQLADAARDDLGDSLRNMTGKNRREPGRVRE